MCGTRITNCQTCWVSLRFATDMTVCWVLEAVLMADRRGTALNATRSILSEIIKNHNYLKFHTVQLSVIHY